jgi:hypothetical protein
VGKGDELIGWREGDIFGGSKIKINVIMPPNANGLMID